MSLLGDLVPHRNPTLLALVSLSDNTIAPAWALRPKRGSLTKQVLLSPGRVQSGIKVKGFNVAGVSGRLGGSERCDGWLMGLLYGRCGNGGYVGAFGWVT